MMMAMMMQRVRSPVCLFCLILLAQSPTLILSEGIRSALRIEELRVRVLPSKALFGGPRVEQVSTKSDRERGWPTWYPKSDTTSTTNATMTTEMSSKKEKRPKKHGSSRWFRRRKDKESPTSTEEDATKKEDDDETLTSDTVKEETKKPDEPSEETTTQHASPSKKQAPESSSNTTTPDESTIPESQVNKTATEPSTLMGETGISPSDMGGRPSVILLGSPSGSHYRQFYRRQTAPGGLAQQQQQRPSTMSPNTVLLVELIASVLGTAARLWLLTWITRRLASQEESLQPTQHFVWELLNDRYSRDVAALKTAIQQPPPGVPAGRWKRKHVRKQGRYKAPRLDLEKTFIRSVVVIEVKSDPRGAIDLEFLSDVVTFLLEQHRSHAFGTQKESGAPMELEVVLLVNSPGGSVAMYGLAAAQVQRLARVPGIALTVCVDRYAASGGYMIASQAERLIVAPFASVGSVGVIMEGLNFHDFAKRYGIQPLVIKAGESKNPFTTYGPISKQDLEHEKERLEKVHEAFKSLILDSRPQLLDRLDTIANGNVFLGQEALDLQLVDGVMTSDEYILERIRAGNRVLRLHRSQQSRFSRRVTLSPLDVLPHLKAWLSDHVLSNLKSSDTITAAVSCLLQAGSILGFVRYLHNQYWNPR